MWKGVFDIPYLEQNRYNALHILSRILTVFRLH
jgi:hypothetical protein